MELNRKKFNEIKKIIESVPVKHHAYVNQLNDFARRFSIATSDYNIYAERIYSFRFKGDIQYSLNVIEPITLRYFTDTANDRYAKRIYKKMQKIWERNRAIAKKQQELAKTR